jgi:alkylation response protein AidB-like acyl-CoA dehydrogenase
VRRDILEQEHDSFREAFRTFIAREVAPHHERWETEGRIDRAMFAAAARAGFVGINIPEEFGGGGTSDFRFNLIMSEEGWLAGVPGSTMCITLHNDVITPYLLAANDEQKARWLPGAADGTLMGAIAMSEPGAGSDLAGMQTSAIRDGDHYVVNGAKTFITNGLNSDFVIVAVKTDPTERHRGISLVVVEAGMPGFERGRKLNKVGLKSQDTAELFFRDVRVPVANRLGDEGTGFAQLVGKLPQERLGIAMAAVAGAEAALSATVDYCKTRHAFGQPLGSFQNTRFVVAEMRTEIDIAQVLIDRQVMALTAGQLSAVDAAESKWWCTEMQKRVVDSCLQLHGGYGYMEEYPIARAWRDTRAQTIYGGSTEIMKEIIGRAVLA